MTKQQIDTQWVLDNFDNFVANNPGTPLDDSRQAFKEDYVRLVESGEIERYTTDIDTEASALFDQAVKPAREQRRNSLRKQVGYMLDALADSTILGVHDPMFMLAYPLGNGTDKVLGYWTRDDWRNATTERYRNAAEATKSASSFDDAAGQIVLAMVNRDVMTTSGLFDRVSADI